MVKIRLMRTGAKNERKFRIVATPAGTKRDGKFLEILGFWIPTENKLKIETKRYNYWIEKGAQPTKAVLQLIAKNCKNGIKS